MFQYRLHGVAEHKSSVNQIACCFDIFCRPNCTNHVNVYGYSCEFVGCTLESFIYSLGRERTAARVKKYELLTMLRRLISYLGLLLPEYLKRPPRPEPLLQKLDQVGGKLMLRLSLQRL